jgi:tetratricopeptide (TPR) repeat protein
MIGAAGFAWWRLESRKLPAEARDLLENGRKWMYEGTVDQVSNAIGALRQAAQIAPHSPDVWGSLAYAYMKQSLEAPAQDRPDLRARANAAIARSLSLEPGQSDALAAQITGMRLFRNWLAVDQASRAALRRHPHHVGLQLNLAGVLMQTGRTREGLDAFDDIIGKVPTSARIFNGRCVALWDLGRLEEADAALARAFTLWPRHFGIWFTNFYYRLYNGKPAEASALVADIGNRPLGIPQWNFENIAVQADAIASGVPTKIQQAIAASVELARRGTGFAENAALFAGFAGDFDSAFSVLDALYFNRGFTLPDAYFAPEQGMYSGEDRHTYNLFRLPIHALRKDRRFAALTRELGLDAFWAATNSRALVTP